MSDYVTWPLVIIVVLAGIPISLWLHWAEMKRGGREEPAEYESSHHKQPFPEECWRRGHTYRLMWVCAICRDAHERRPQS